MAAKRKAAKKAAPKKAAKRRSATRPRRNPFGQTAAEEKQQKAQNDLRTLRDAEEIRGDKARVTAAEKEGKKQMDALKRTISGSEHNSSHQ